MSLKIIYGRSGTGKSEFVFNDAISKMNSSEKIYIITPEQFSFSSEKRLLEKINQKATIQIEVLTFNRMAYRIMNDIGGRTKIGLSNAGKSMIIYDILYKEQKNLKFLGKTNKNVDVFQNIITEFKKHNITIDNIENAIKNIENMYIKTKLEDINIMYKKYNESIQNKYIDENDVLTILSQNILKINTYKNSIIYIDEFIGFTPQEYNIIQKLLKMCKQINVTACIENFNITENLETDIFLPNKRTVSNLIDIAKKDNILIENPIYLKTNYRFKVNELRFLEENIYELNYKKYLKEPKNITLFLANNYYSELENVANNITDLVRNNGLKYNDISIITKNLDTYTSIVKAVFNKYNIPIYIDEKKDINKNIVIKYIIAFVDVFVKNWSYESVFNYIKSGFLDIEDYNDIYELENYCIKWGIKYSKWYKEDWNYGCITEEDIKEISHLNEIRRKIVNPLLEFSNSIQNSNTVYDITKEIYEFIKKNKIEENLKNKIEILYNQNNLELVNEYENSLDLIIEVLDEIVMIFGNEKMHFTKYVEILKIGFSNKDIRKDTVKKRSSYYGRC